MTPPMRTYPDVWPETSIDIGERSDARPNSSDAFLRHAILRRRLPVRNLNQRNDPQLSNASSIREEEMRLHHTITRRSIPEVSRLAAGLPMSASAVWTSQPHPADVFHHRERTENQLRSTQLWGEMDVETFPVAAAVLHWNRRDSTPRLFAFPNDPTLAGGRSGGSTHRADTLPPLRRGRAQSISPSRDSARTSSTSSLAASSAAARSLRMRALRRRPSDLMGLDQTSDVSRLGGYRSFVSARTRHIGDYMRDEDLDTSYEGLLRLSTFLGEVGPRGTPDHVVSSLPNGLYKDWAKPGETDERCPICLDDYAPTDPVLKIPGCSHWFHKTCLEKWLKTARSCPVCRGRVATQQQTRSVAGPSGSGGASRRVRIVDLMQDDSSEDEDGDITPRRRSTPPPPWRS
ncbi:E3 ubiquitin ligase BIG BROTHER-related protein [Grifola frondosa]|uniref:E3 ubiquitin ligase BIG BROTHER-related protein n=1 Tax=Grifola frondosa TaxID=5627 RepID=A0A1C7ML12_GRIFR|nr:E3 ubiquitin ligase BIG BROTHER-related protein [Grifola frondosa]